MKKGAPRLLALGLSLLALFSLPGQASEMAVASRLPQVVDAPLQFERPVPPAAPVDKDWFADAVFVGDTRLEGLREVLEPGLILTHSQVNVRSAQQENCFLLSDGQSVTLAKALSGGGWGKVYLLLGLNEASWMDEGAFYREYAQLIGTLRDLLPGAAIYIQTLIPVTAYRSAAQSPSNQLLSRRSELLAQVAQAERVYLVDAATALSGADGALSSDLSGDGLQLTAEATGLWGAYLQTHTVGK